MTKQDIEAFIESQSAMVKKPRTMEKCVMVKGVPWRVLFNSERSRSTLAAVDKASVEARPCFLCEANRFDWQRPLEWRGYDILVNPFPVLPGHLTIAARRHTRQEVEPHIPDMVELSAELEGFAVFYNGPASGASAPDHLHFQAVPGEWLNLHRSFPFERFYVSGTKEKVISGLREAIGSMPLRPDEYEPRLNMAVKCVGGDEYEAVVIPRKAHRPACYDAVHVSPGALDMFGYIVTTSLADFEAVDTALLETVFSEVAFECDVPMVRVGIVTADEVCYRFHGPFRQDGCRFVPESDGAEFELENVVIGVGFHWERHENQRFKGTLELMKNADGTTTAVNILPVEEYLQSVISSEMSAHASLELLKAHAVISRSWLLAQMSHKNSVPEPRYSGENMCGRVIKWYDHDDHTGFDVCADDHCQRYHGAARIDRQAVYEAVQSTLGEVLVDSDGSLCDARFSKCCGGAFEEFENCWEPVHHSYLEAARDVDDAVATLPDLTQEDAARDWIMSRPDAFCASPGADVLAQVLNSYDRETPDFYRWKVEYAADELSELVCRRSGIDFGDIVDLVPEKRGKSGRIYELRIVGTKRTVTVGKELEIRKWLSESHLYSSAFVPERTSSGWVLYGAGWGHGVGLCQIGAAVMGARGYGYKDILHHYFKNAEIERAY